MKTWLRWWHPKLASPSSHYIHTYIHTYILKEDMATMASHINLIITWYIHTYIKNTWLRQHPILISLSNHTWMHTENMATHIDLTITSYICKYIKKTWLRWHSVLTTPSNHTYIHTYIITEDMATMVSHIDHTITSFIHTYIHTKDMAFTTWFSLHRTYVMNGCIFYVVAT